LDKIGRDTIQLLIAVEVAGGNACIRSGIGTLADGSLREAAVAGLVPCGNPWGPDGAISPLKRNE
jgi:hypothetical protein